MTLKNQFDVCSIAHAWFHLHPRDHGLRKQCSSMTSNAGRNPERCAAALSIPPINQHPPPSSSRSIWGLAPGVEGKPLPAKNGNFGLQDATP